jgi:glycosyltransferase involved in cell wall biosynthesis
MAEPAAGAWTPLVSVVVPVHNGERYVGEAIRSILAQTYRPIEIIVIDDGSTDGSAAVAARYPAVRTVSQPHAGPGAARNRGIELAQGACIGFLDADDLWTPDKLERQTAVLRASPEVDMVFGRARQFHSPDLAPAARERIAGAGSVLAGYVPGAMLIRRAAWHRVGPFTTAARVGEFLDWYARAQDAGLRDVLLPEVLLLRRLHGDNLGRRERAAALDYAKVLKASLDRRRLRLR